jgi:pimeloyl-ACP methyl ester carboxylesterase
MERRGRRALVPSLVGVADAPPPQWRHCVDEVSEALGDEDDPVLLVGHSGAGPLLPAVADAAPLEVAGLIFVDAALPPESGAASLAPEELMEQLRGLARDEVLPRWSDWFGDDVMRELVPDEALREDLEREMPRMPLTYFEADVPVPERWSDQPCAFLLLSVEQYGESAEEARRRGWPEAELRGANHLTTATDPVAVVDQLLGLEARLRNWASRGSGLREDD